MKRYFLLFISLMVILTSCKPLEDQVGSEEDPFFFLQGQSITPINLRAGKNNFYHFTRHRQDELSVFEFIAELKNDSCANCDEQFKLLIRSNEPIADSSQLNIFENIRAGNYEYAQSLSLSRHRRIEFRTDLGTQPVGQVRWEFGDGHGSTNPVETHVYAHDSIYQVRMFYTEGGCTSMIQKTVEVSPDSSSPYCKADFDYQIVSPLQVKFTGNDTAYGGSFLWDFGDGNFSTEPNPTYNYAIPGDYQITMRLERLSLGCSSTVKKNVNTALIALPCQTNFHFQNARPTMNDSMQLFTITVIYIDKNGVEYRSDFVQQEASSFQLSDVQPYERNELNNPVVIFQADFSCKLMSEDLQELDWNNFRGRLGVSYPK